MSGLGILSIISLIFPLVSDETNSEQKTMYLWAFIYTIVDTSLNLAQAILISMDEWQDEPTPANVAATKIAANS